MSKIIKKDTEQCTLHGVSSRYYKILDKDGIEMPLHYSGRYRTYDEAIKMTERLNKSGEHKPYTMVAI